MRCSTPIADAVQADVSFGSRFAQARVGRRASRAWRCCLTRAHGPAVTDPTSGFCAFGPRAIRLLSDHHPTGYGEAELLLFLSRNGLRAEEVPVACPSADRRAHDADALRGDSPPSRASSLAMLIVPLRSEVRKAGLVIDRVDRRRVLVSALLLVVVLELVRRRRR